MPKPSLLAGLSVLVLASVACAGAQAESPAPVQPSPTPASTPIVEPACPYPVGALSGQRQFVGLSCFVINSLVPQAPAGTVRSEVPGDVTLPAGGGVTFGAADAPPVDTLTVVNWTDATPAAVQYDGQRLTITVPALPAGQQLRVIAAPLQESDCTFMGGPTDTVVSCSAGDPSAFGPMWIAFTLQ